MLEHTMVEKLSTSRDETKARRASAGRRGANRIGSCPHVGVTRLNEKLNYLRLRVCRAVGSQAPTDAKGVRPSRTGAYKYTAATDYARHVEKGLRRSTARSDQRPL
jgi:hypothetical protein